MLGIVSDLKRIAVYDQRSLGDENDFTSYMQLFSRHLNVQISVKLSLVGSTFEGMFSCCLIFYCLHVLSRVAWAASILVWILIPRSQIAYMNYFWENECKLYPPCIGVEIKERIYVFTEIGCSLVIVVPSFGGVLKILKKE